MNKFPIIFLDIDGVLNCYGDDKEDDKDYITGMRWGIKKSSLSLIKQLVDKTNAKIVLSSSWKAFWIKDNPQNSKNGTYLVNCLKMFDLELYDKTPNITKDNKYSRAIEIQTWIDEHKDIIDKYVLIDDEFKDDFDKHNFTGKYVITDSKTGICQEDINDAIEVLKGNNITCERNFDKTFWRYYRKGKA